MFIEDKLTEYIKGIRVNGNLVNLLRSANRIIAFSPHPDDVEVIAGGYLAMMSDKGASVKVIVVSDGRMGMGSMEYAVDEVVAIRRREELEAMRILGVHDVEFLNYIDSEVPEPGILRRDFIRVIRSFKPDVAVTVDPSLPYEAHPDHVNTGLAVMQAVLFHGIPRVLSEYKVESQPPVLALGATVRLNAIVCINDVIDKEINALRTHKNPIHQ
ncbi:PIG-L deacetylase family protein [Caldivirga maquilingensis]|uniref:LmbE family protein n=1 Tax=Caldivirga maquilingensis (strain ATCC 700844 / DSM 13496 / JCM 10307 / IC-167) TaxID=397948 RepID=A8MD12_CALMQ|nr:PIG-L family deacetylase [Caldivirga maquilingensis]ABW01668.1 LmbE family protein [Caldivirga maquilingensis IC-167]